MEHTSAFRRSLAIQGRVLHALLMREVITRFGRNNLGALWIFGEPMLFTLGVTAFWTTAGFHHASNLPIVAFGVTGYSSVLLWRNCATRCSLAIQSNLGLLFHRNVRTLDLFLMRILLEVIGATTSFLVLSLAFIWIDWMPVPVDFLKLFAGWAMLAWFGTALALLVGAGTARSHLVEKLWHPAAYLLFPLSGTAFMVDWLPSRFQEVVLMLPMVHGIEMVRDGYFGNVVKTHFDVGYMVMICLLMTLAGLHWSRNADEAFENL